MNNFAFFNDIFFFWRKASENKRLNNSRRLFHDYFEQSLKMLITIFLFEEEKNKINYGFRRLTLSVKRTGTESQYEMKSNSNKNPYADISQHSTRTKKCMTISKIILKLREKWKRRSCSATTPSCHTHIHTIALQTPSPHLKWWFAFLFFL